MSLVSKGGKPSSGLLYIQADPTGCAGGRRGWRGWLTLLVAGCIVVAVIITDVQTFGPRKSDRDGHGEHPGLDPGLMTYGSPVTRHDVGVYLRRFHETWSNVSLATRHVGVTEPYHDVVQHLFGARDELQNRTLHCYGTVTARLLAYRRWAADMQVMSLPGSPTARALAFQGLAVQPFGGPDLLGLMAMFPSASAYWIHGDFPIGAADYLFWGRQRAHEYMKAVVHELRRSVGPHGHTMSNEQKRHAYPMRGSGVDGGLLQPISWDLPPNSVAAFPLLFAMLTLTGHRVVEVQTSLNTGDPKLDKHTAQVGLSLESDSIPTVTTITFCTLLDAASAWGSPNDETEVAGKEPDPDMSCITKEGRNTTKTLTYSFVPTGVELAARLQLRRQAAERVTDKIDAAREGHLDGLAAYLVAAEYALFNDAVKNDAMRDLLTSTAKVVVQDDTGIPFKELVTHFPDIDMYGSYGGPAVLPFVPSTALAAVVQPNLMLFSNVTRRTRRSGALPAFTMGYSHWSVRPSLSTDLGSGQCLLFAQRQPVPKPTEQR